MSFFSVLRFLTILPAPSGKDDVPPAIGRSLGFFPLVGLIIGIILAALCWALGMVFPVPVSAALTLVALEILTGGHHVDGLIDTFDALVAGKTTQQRLEIMSDTRVGAFGITAACMLLITKYAAMSSAGSFMPILVFPVLSRWALTGSILIFPSAKNEGSGFAVKNTARWAGFACATATTLIVIIFSLGIIAGPLLMIALLALTSLIAQLFSRLFGGLTGDCYGALVEIGEVLALLLIILLTPLAQSVAAYSQFQLPFLRW